MAEELGDVLLQVVLHAQIAQEEKRFDLGDVIGGLVEKLIRLVIPMCLVKIRERT